MSENLKKRQSRKYSRESVEKFYSKCSINAAACKDIHTEGRINTLPLNQPLNFRVSPSSSDSIQQKNRSNNSFASPTRKVKHTRRRTTRMSLPTSQKKLDSSVIPSPITWIHSHQRSLLKSPESSRVNHLMIFKLAGK